MPKEINPGCVDCPLKGNKRLLPVLSDIEEGTRTLFVGEAPTNSEVTDGELAKGKDGLLFRRMIDRFKIRNYAVTNACLCWPGYGKKAKVTHMDYCSIWLETFIADYNPDRIICLGKAAARAVLGKEVAKQKMYKLREQSPLVVFPDMFGPPLPTEGRQVFVTYSPKAIYKRPKLIDDFVADFDFVFNPPKETWIDPKVTFLTGTPKEIIGTAIDGKLMQFFINHHLSNYQAQAEDMVGPVAIDFETTGLHPIADRPVTLGLSFTPQKAVVVDLHNLTDEGIKQVLAFINKELNRSTAVVYHESKFDMKFFKHWSGIKPQLGWDTKLVDYIHSGNPIASRGLKYLARRKLFAPAYSKDITFDGTTDLEEMAIYNGRDASATLQLYNYQHKNWFKDKDSCNLMLHLYDVTDMLVDTELKGAPVREEWLAAKRTELNLEAVKYQALFAALDLNPRSPKQVREFFGTKSSDKEALKAVDSKVAKDILAFRAITKELSTYVDGFSEHIVNGRVHSDYRVPGTLTGRLASRSPNMMNLKSDDDEEKDYQLVVDTSEPDMVIKRFDYSQIEMRKMAVECLDEHLLDIFRTGRDIHDELQKEIFGNEYDAESNTQRVHAKTTNFGTIYGISPYGLSKLLKTDEADAKRYLATWYSMYPQVKDWQEEIRDHVRKYKMVKTQFGRIRRVDLEYLVVYEDAIFRECINFPIQSESCDIYLKAALAIYRKTGLYPIQLVHDELVYELATDDLNDTIDFICWKMKRVAEDLTGHIVPFPVEVK